jgi:hypothetical protein
MKSKVHSPKSVERRVSSVERRGPQHTLVLRSVFGEPGSRKRASEGVALVITLILLSVITFMAITFLVVSRGEKSTVGSVTEQTTARLAAEQGLELAQSAMISQILAFTDPYDVGLLVSTNYINPFGFNTAGALRGYLTNVSYTYPNGTPLNNFNDQCQNLANLFYLPRVPVYMTNRVFGSNQFVFYLDLNRNGRYDTNGFLPIINELGGFYDTNGNKIATPIAGGTLSNFFRGDPEWVGVLERGNYTPGLYNDFRIGRKFFPVGMPHSADNLFISRYAYVVIPTSAALDINYMHNYAKELTDPLMSFDGFWRNQGVGSWEINMAALLADLNTNTWNSNSAPYSYDKTYSGNPQSPGFLANRGFAFDDAVALLRYRYGRRWLNLANVSQTLGANGANVFQGDSIDGYTYGEMTGPWWNPTPDSDAFRITRNVSWSGSDNLSNYFDMQDLLDRNKVVPNIPAPVRFADRLAATGNGISSYDRYTFYRLLEQLGAESAPESPKMNLNFADMDAGGNIVPNLATNFLPWLPVQFFTNAAARMLAEAGYGTNIVDYIGGIPKVHIQIYPTNYYSPSVHRYLQLAANIYDASTNRTFNVPNATNGFPSIFRPIFFDEGSSPGGTNRVWITGYTEVTNIDVTLVGTNLAQLRPFHDLNDPGDRRPVRPTDMVYGVPLVIGAKKGLPNFNEFGLLQDISVGRNLIFHRRGTALTTNQVYTMGISNVFAIEAWNSYVTPYPRNLELVAVADVITSVTNEAGICRDANNNFLSAISSYPVITNIVASSWRGYTNSQSRQSFVFPLGARTYLFLTNSDFSFNQNRFLPASQTTTDPQNFFPVPRWKVLLRPRVRFALLDLDAQRIIDYVNISEQQDPVDVAQILQGKDNGGDATCNGNFNGEMGSFFCTNRVGASLNPAVATYGILNQFGVSIGSIQVSDAFWRNFNPQEPDRGPSQDKFRNRILGSDTTPDFAAPFVPRRVIHHSISWQANDPLVHYVAGDLQDPLSGKRKISYDTDGRGGIAENDNPLVGFPIGSPNAQRASPLNQHYRPWGGNPNHAGDSAPPTAKRFELKDSMIRISDNWSFMTNKFPNVGWLGRVHRGTPWQTLFLKSASIDIPTWTNWVGNNFMLMNYDDRGSSNYDAIFSLPTNDFRVLDLFTTAFNENASKGQLSVNQTNIAAWSAILSGVIVNRGGLSNPPVFIEPAGVYNPFAPSNSLPPLVQIVNGINAARRIMGTNGLATIIPYQGRGDILRVPALTVGSPYLQGANPDSTPDWVYERIPQQIMGLLRGGDEPPRFVIYAFGQALKPAEHSLVTASGSFFGLCTNYQVTAESVIRAVVRVDNAPTPRSPNNIPRVYVESFNVLAPY